MAIARFVMICGILELGLCVNPKLYMLQTFPKTTIVDNYPTLVVEKDRDAFMACAIDNKPVHLPVQWYAYNYNTNKTIPISTDTETYDSFKYQLDKPATNNWRLKIQNVQPTDEALFICRIQLDERYQSANISRMVRVIQKPQIIDIYTSSDMVKKEGDNAELKCAASGIPPPLIRWQLVGDGILPTGGRELVGSKIEIPYIRREYKGHYKCIAENISGRDVRVIALDVRFSPVASAQSEEVYQAPGYSRELKCEVLGYPIPTEQQLMWFREGNKLTDTNKYVVENYIGSNFVLMKLTIKNINSNDYGAYRCYGENVAGSGSDTITLKESSSYVSNRPAT